jgi:3-phenylpropionate/cinnamic acid dioxygenase small subunit
MSELIDRLVLEGRAGVRLPEERTCEWQAEVEQFYYLEAELLDERRYADWLAMFADDLHYLMPTRSNRLVREADRENSTTGQVCLFDDTKESLGWRVRQFETGRHWAEDPPSRTRHLVTNVRVQDSDERDEYRARSNFFVYRNRLDTELDMWVGERTDVLRRTGDRCWAIAKRTVLLDQNVVLSKNMSVFI